MLACTWAVSLMAARIRQEFKFPIIAAVLRRMFLYLDYQRVVVSALAVVGNDVRQDLARRLAVVAASNAQESLTARPLSRGHGLTEPIGIEGSLEASSMCNNSG